MLFENIINSKIINRVYNVAEYYHILKKTLYSVFNNTETTSHHD